MEFVDFATAHHQRSAEADAVFPAYYENVMHQLNYNPALIVVALTVYVLLVLLGILTNTRVMSVVGRRIRASPFAFDIQLMDMDVLVLCVANLVAVVCFMFVIFDLVYGQWMLPSRMLCRLYLSAQGFVRIVSGMVLLHLVLLGMYFVRKLRHDPAAISTGVISKVATHYFYILVLSPGLALVFSVMLFEHADIHFLTTQTPPVDLENNTELVTVEKCVLVMSNRMTTWLIVYGSICGYLAPVIGFILASVFCWCRCRNISNPRLQRYVNLVTSYAILFILCHTPSWVTSVYDFMSKSNAVHQNGLALINYLAHTISYLPCVGYPVLYLRSMTVNRVSTDAPGSPNEVRRDETIVSLVSAQRTLGRGQSRDGLLTNRPMRARTFSNVHMANADAIISLAVQRRSSYHTLPDAKEEEDRM